MKALHKNGLIILIIMVLFCALASPAVAQTTTESYHIPFGTDVSGGHYLFTDYSFTLGAPYNQRGNPINGGGAEYETSPAPGYHHGMLTINLPAGCLLEGWEYQFYYGSTYGSAQLWLEYRNGGGSWTTLNLSPGTHPQGVWNTHTGTESSLAATELRLDWLTPSDSESVGEITVDNIKFTCSNVSASGGVYGGPFQPIAEELQVEVITPRNESGLVNGASRITANTSSAVLGGTPVYASISGIIGNVTPNSIELLGEVNGEEWEILYRNLETIYVQPGDIVDAECIIALAAPATTQTTESEATDLKGLSFRIINLDTESFEDWELFSSPSGTRICGSLVQGGSCLNPNPYLNDNASAWNVTPSDTGIMPDRDDGMISLVDDQSMFQYAALDEGETYYVTIAARMMEVPVGGRSAQLRVTLGDDFDLYDIYADLPGDIRTEPLLTGEQSVFIVGPLEPDTADLAPNLYKLAIENNATLSKVEINYVCLTESDTTPIAPYSTCYFDNLGDFSTTGETMHDSFGTEFIALDDTETITYEDLTLSGYDDADTEYHIEVVVSSSDEDESNAAATTSPDLTLSYNDGTEYAVRDVYAIPYYARQFKMLAFTIEIPEDEIVTADLIITHDQQASTDSEFIYISNICLIAPTGWPGYDSTPGTGGGSTGSGGPSPGTGACAPVITPISTNLWEWILWLFAAVEKFVRCTLIGEIRKIVDSIKTIGEWILNFGSWLLGVFNLLGNWVYSLTLWAIYNLLTLLGGFIELLWNGLINLPLFQGLFDLMSLGWIAFNLLFDIGAAAIAALLYVMNLLSALAQAILILWGAILEGLNTAVAVETGLPTCSTITGDELFYSFCASITLMDHIFTLWPAILIPLTVMVAAMCFFTATKGLSWVGKTLAEVG